MIYLKRFRFLLLIGMILFTMAPGLFGGVRQMGSTNLAGSQTANYGSYGTVVVGSYYSDYSGWAGTSPVEPAIPIGTILEYAPSSAVPVMVQGNRYYYENNIYLAEVFDGTSVVYQVVPAPSGAVVTQLPAGCIVQTYNGKSLQLCGSTYYRQVAGGYEVVATQ
jgi:hypothetical protein